MDDQHRLTTAPTMPTHAAAVDANTIIFRRCVRRSEAMLIYSMSVSVDGFVADREGAFGWTTPSEEQFRLQRWPAAGSQLAVVPDLVEGREVELLVEGAGGGMPGVDAGGDDRQGDALNLDLGDRPLHESGAETRALVGGVDGDVNLARPGGVLVDEAGSDEAHRAIADDGDPDVPVRSRLSTTPRPMRTPSSTGSPSGS